MCHPAGGLDQTLVVQVKAERRQQMVQVFLDKHPELFETGLERADLKIFLLCLILGLTGWAGLCRLLRAETLKLRELEYVQAATAFGVSHWRIMQRHVLIYGVLCGRP